MRGRPSVQIEAPSVVRPGERFEVGVALDSRSVTPIDFVELGLVGEERVFEDGDPPILTEALVAQRLRLSEASTLSIGRRWLRAELSLPADLPPSYEGAGVALRYALELSVSIPWWPGVALRRPLRVVPGPGPRLAARPAITRDRSVWLTMDLALVDRSFSPGDRLRGEIAVTAGDEIAPEHHPRIRRAAVALVGIERITRPDGATTTERARHPAQIEGDELSRGRPVGFSLLLPRDLPLTYFTPRSALYWQIESRAELPDAVGEAHTIACEIPVLITPLEGEPPVAEAPPEIGLARQRRAWGEAGAPYGLRLDEEELRLQGEIAGSTVTLAYVEHALVAAIRYADLGLDLRLVGILADGRDPAQIRAAFDPAIGQALSAFPEATMSDTQAFLHPPRYGPGSSLAELVGNAARLAAWIGVLRERIPPPTAMASALPGYRALAATLGARLTVGSMSIHGGALADQRLDVLTEHEGPVPRRTKLILHLASPLAAPLDNADPDSLGPLPDEARQLALAFAADRCWLRAEGAALILTMVPPALDGARLGERARDLGRLGQALRGRRGGPYR